VHRGSWTSWASLVLVVILSAGAAVESSITTSSVAVVRPGHFVLASGTPSIYLTNVDVGRQYTILLGSKVVFTLEPPPNWSVSDLLGNGLSADGGTAITPLRFHSANVSGNGALTAIYSAVTLGREDVGARYPCSLSLSNQCTGKVWFVSVTVLSGAKNTSTTRPQLTRPNPQLPLCSFSHFVSKVTTDKSKYRLHEVVKVTVSAHYTGTKACDNALGRAAGDVFLNDCPEVSADSVQSDRGVWEYGELDTATGGCTGPIDTVIPEGWTQVTPVVWTQDLCGALPPRGYPGFCPETQVPSGIYQIEGGFYDLNQASTTIQIVKS
jgi:hypothetical protein